MYGGKSVTGFGLGSGALSYRLHGRGSQRQQLKSRQCLQAMRLLVAELRKRPCGEVKRPRITAPEPRQRVWGGLSVKDKGVREARALALGVVFVSCGGNSK